MSASNRFIYARTSVYGRAGLRGTRTSDALSFPHEGTILKA